MCAFSPQWHHGIFQLQLGIKGLFPLLLENKTDIANKQLVLGGTFLVWQDVHVTNGFEITFLSQDIIDLSRPIDK